MITQFKKGALELCVLSLIYKKDCYGYEMVEIISRGIEVSEGTIYPLLRRFTNESYCITYLKESREGPPRKYYSITEAGKKRYRDLFKQWQDFSKQVDYIVGLETSEMQSDLSKNNGGDHH